MIREVVKKIFRLQENKTYVAKEVCAGIDTYLATVFIFAVNPAVLSVATEMSKTAIFVSTVIVSVLGTMLMALLANYPFVLTPGMVSSAFLTYTVVLSMGDSWESVLTAVILEGLIFTLMSFTGIREMIYNSVPINLKKSINVGLGLFIIFVSLQQANILVEGPILVEFFDFNTATSTEIVTVSLTLVGIIVTAVLSKRVKGGMFVGIIFTWVVGIIFELCGLYIPDSQNDTLLPVWNVDFRFFKEIFERSDFESSDFVGEVGTIAFMLVYVNIIVTVADLKRSEDKAKIDNDKDFSRGKSALLANALSTILSGVLGTPSTTIVYGSGITVRGKTGLTSVVTALLFSITLILTPVFIAIPIFAIVPAMVIVGAKMVEDVKGIEFCQNTKKKKRECMLPYISCIIGMMYNPIYGISIGVVLTTGTYICKRRKLPLTMYMLTIITILYWCYRFV